ncbi:hypothetical protein BGX29_007749 [Mortierella sp. GBA35]|nr:hypothetical protein BGX29_007749 [Mortierella sp. GBA35]
MNQRPVAHAQIVEQAPKITSSSITPSPTKTPTTNSEAVPTTTDPGLIGLPTLPPEPEVAVYTASCQTEGTWYIQGGYHIQSIDQLYSLDLTTPWNTTWPPWVEYADTPSLSSQNCAFASKGDLLRFNDIDNSVGSKKTIFAKNPLGAAGSVLAIVGNEDPKHPFISALNMTTGTWHYNASSISVPVRNAGISNVVNPLDGRIYMRGGHQNTMANTMDIYDPRKDTLISFSIPLTNDTIPSVVAGGKGVPYSQWYSSVWSSRRSSILYFGGRIGMGPNYTSPDIFEYKPDSNTWAFLPTTGTGPTEREDACMETAWTRGPNAGNGRLGMACAMYNDGFLVWGGSTDTFLVYYPTADPAVFNLTTMRWTDRYNQHDPLEMDPKVVASGGGSKLGLILGLSIGLLALAAMIGGIFLFQREKRKTVQDYDMILSGKGLDLLQGQSLGASPYSGTTYPDGQSSIDPTVPPRAAVTAASTSSRRRSRGPELMSSAQHSGRQRGLLTAERSTTNRHSGGRHSGSDGSWRDDASIRTATSGKYVLETDDEAPTRTPRRRQQDRSNSRLGHKMETPSMGPQGDGSADLTTSLNRNGDPTNISPACPPHAIAPYAAPSAPPNPDIRQR